MQNVKIVRKYMLTLILKTDRNTPPPQIFFIILFLLLHYCLSAEKAHNADAISIAWYATDLNFILLKDKNKANSRYETFFLYFPFHICEYCKKNQQLTNKLT